MSTLVENPLDRLLEPVARCLPADVARKVVQLRVDSQTQDRIDELAAKANQGTLSPLNDLARVRAIAIAGFAMKS